MDILLALTFNGPGFTSNTGGIHMASSEEPLLALTVHFDIMYMENMCLPELYLLKSRSFGHHTLQNGTCSNHRWLQLFEVYLSEVRKVYKGLKNIKSFQKMATSTCQACRQRLSARLD